MDARPSAPLYPKLGSSEDSLLVDVDTAATATATAAPSINKKAKNVRVVRSVVREVLAASMMLRVYALARFGALLYAVTHIPWTRDELPIVSVVLGLDAVLLLASACQNCFTLCLAWVVAFCQLMAAFLCLVFAPLATTSYFASGAGDQFISLLDRIKFRTDLELHVAKGFELGFAVLLLSLFFVFVAMIQCSLISTVLRQKLDELREKRQKTHNEAVVA